MIIGGNPRMAGLLMFGDEGERLIHVTPPTGHVGVIEPVA